MQRLSYPMRSCRPLPCFPSQSPSLLAFDKERAEGNLHTIYGMERVPCDTRMREILDPVSPKVLRPVFTQRLFGNSSVAGHLNRWCFLMGTIYWPSMVPGIFPPRRFTVPRVYKRSTETVRSRMLTRC